MVKRVHKTNGYYHINNHKYNILIGSRAQVWHGTAYKTPGGLTKHNLLINKHGRVVSKKKHTSAKKEKRLEKAGYKPQKGKFMLMRKSMKKPRSARRKNKSKRLGGGVCEIVAVQKIVLMFMDWAESSKDHTIIVGSATTIPIPLVGMKITFSNLYFRLSFHFLL